MGLGKVLSGLLRELVLLKGLVVSISYALLKKLICGISVFLCMVGTMISKLI